VADPGPSYSCTSHKLNVWALKWAERQETTHSGRLVTSYISNDLKAKNDPFKTFTAIASTSALSFLYRPGVFRPEAIAPLPNGFVGDGNSTFGQKVFHIPQAQTEAMVQPNRVTDDCRRKSVFMV